MVQTDKGKGASVRKRSAGSTTTGNERRKTRRISAGEGMSIMAGSMETSIDSLKDTITDVVQRTPHSEARDLEAQAIKAIEKGEDFDFNDLAYAARVMTGQPSRANMYLSMESKGARTSYLLGMMEELKQGK